ncbi:MAG: four helix bundle protein [Candidatus Yanofskybacteria bacterium]|nr:four helix bundle protein [Candidatus Yanofskybacteria bacterium]
MHSYRDLVVWQRSIELVIEIYTLTDRFPKEEIYGLISQLRRAAVSIPSNIAEGRYRGTRKDFRQFLLNAYGSGAEVETQLVIANKLPKTKNLNYVRANKILDEVMLMLNSLIKKLETS